VQHRTGGGFDHWQHRFRRPCHQRRHLVHDTVELVQFKP
jgi:hypothetical protein